MSNYSDLILGHANLVAYWRLGDSSGNALDEVGSNDGTLTGATQSVKGIPSEYSGDTAYSFDGVNDLVEVPYSATINPTGDFSAEAWFLVTGGAGTNRQPLESQKDDFSQGYAMFFEGNDFRCLWSNNVGGDHTVIATGYGSSTYLNTWIHAVMVFDASSGQTGVGTFYVNGVSIGSTASFTFVNNTTGPLRLGRSAHPSIPLWYPGRVDEVAIYNSALDASTVLSHYQAGHPGVTVANSRAHYEGSTTAYWTAPVLHDTGSTLYAVLQDLSGGSPKVRVYKANNRTDPTSMTEQDSADNKAITNVNYPYCSWLHTNGDLHIAVFTATNTLTHYVFDTDADQWVAGNGNISTVAQNERPIRMVVRSDGDILVFFTDLTDDADLNWSRWEGASWTAGVAGILGVSSTEASTIADAGIDSSDRAWVAWYNCLDDDFEYRSINSSNTLTSIIDVETSGPTSETAHSAGGRFKMYDASGTDSVILAYINSGPAIDERIASLEADAASGRLGTEAAVESTTSEVGARTPISTAALSGVPYVSWWDDADAGSINYSTKSGGSWAANSVWRSGVGRVTEIVPIGGGMAAVYQLGGAIHISMLVPATVAKSDTETISPTVTETDSVAAAIADTETISPTVTEADSVNATKSNTETISPTVTEADSVAAAIADTETISPTITETQALQQYKTNTETISPTITEAESTAPAIADTESIAPTITETDAVAAAITSTESVSPTITEADAVSTMVAEAESVSPTITEADAVSATITDTDSVAPTVAETDAVASANVDTETVSPTISEVDAVVATITDTETISPTITETDDVENLGGEVTPVSDTETISPTVTESEALAASIADSETISPTITESETLGINLTDTETLSVAVSEAETVAAALQDSETVSPSVSEAETLAAAIASTESVAPTITETSSVLELVTDSDTISPTVTEAETLGIALVESDALSVAITESDAILAALADTESISPTITELEEVIHGAIPKDDTDTLSVLIDEVESLLRIYGVIYDRLEISVVLSAELDATPVMSGFAMIEEMEPAAELQGELVVV